jgi:hypothetical protein
MHDLFTVCFYYASEILCTRYREPVQYIGSLDLLKVACKRQKNESGNCSIWNKFYIEDVLIENVVGKSLLVDKNDKFVLSLL